MSTDMEVGIDFETLRGSLNEIVVKELSMAAKNIFETFCFRSPYSMTSHSSDENGHNWEDGHIAYHDLYTVVSESVRGFTHL